MVLAKRNAGQGKKKRHPRDSPTDSLKIIVEHPNFPRELKIEKKKKRKENQPLQFNFEKNGH